MNAQRTDAHRWLLLALAITSVSCKKETPKPTPAAVSVAATPKAAGRVEAEREVAASGVISPTQNLDGILRPAVTISTNKIDQRALSPGASRFGGMPDVPSDFVWPTHVPPRNETLERLYQNMGDAGVAPKPGLPDGVRSYPLQFLAQLNLAQIAKAVGTHEASTWLPSEGYLYFFYDVEHGGWGYDPKLLDGFRVIYREQSGPLRPSEPPKELGERSPVCALTFKTAYVLPMRGDSLFDKLQIDVKDSARVARYGALQRALRGSGKGPRHHLLGHPDLIQNDLRLEAQLVQHGLFCGDETGFQDPKAEGLKAGAEDWNLLLQIDTDENCPGWMWGDSGTLYFLIRDQDLKARRFDKATMVLQCY